jgi:hypothetical protein
MLGAASGSRRGPRDDAPAAILASVQAGASGNGAVRQDPATRVSAPAIGLLIAGGLSAAFTLGWLVIVGVIGVAAVADREIADALPGLGIWITLAIVKLALDGLTIVAGLQMRQLRSWGLSLAGSIAAMLPCSICCILGLPLGVWALLVLVDDEVKRAFNGGGPPGGYGEPPGGFSDPRYPPQA